ncbi:MAG: glycogen/starch synthase [Clostridiales bacterium]|nr:glycogen/starch synthase [Clostridiales bacterium]
MDKPTAARKKRAAAVKNNPEETPEAAQSKPGAARKTPQAAQSKPRATRKTSEAAQSKPRATRKKSAEKVPAEKVSAEAPAQKADANRHVLFAASEAFPFAGTGGLGEVIGSLPAAVNHKNAGVEARIILPLYESVSEAVRKSMTHVAHYYVPLSWRNQYCGLFRYEQDGTVVYFLDNEYYFKRGNLYGYGDDGERFAFFSRAVLETLPYLGWKVDVIHCHDWQTALIPVYYKLFYMYRPEYAYIETIFTIHNLEYQGKFGKEVIEDLFGIPQREYPSVAHDGCINLMRAAIDYADRVTTVSETYAQEIRTREHGHGLDGVLNSRAYKLSGILNGINVTEYDPAANRSMFQNYSAKTLADKAVNKAELQKLLSLPVCPKVPIIAFISRLVPHKGVDLIRYALGDIMKENVQIVILGTGDMEYENFFRHMEGVSGGKLRAILAFNKDLAQKVYAGADIFLMPSRSEPCGLSQMIACRYGTVPVVRATGGLKDSIADCGEGNSGNGFVFFSYSTEDMLYAIRRAVGLYRDYAELFMGLAKRAALSDFSWDKSAGRYIEYYSHL